MKIRPEILEALIPLGRQYAGESRSIETRTSDQIHKLVSLWRADGGEDGPLVDWLEGLACSRCDGSGLDGGKRYGLPTGAKCGACHGTGRVPVKEKASGD